jgi:hypothetical protein
MFEILSAHVGKVGAVVEFPPSVNVRALVKAGLVRAADPVDDEPPVKATRKAAAKDGE